MIPPSIWLLEERCDATSGWREWGETDLLPQDSLEDAELNRECLLRDHPNIEDFDTDHRECNHEVRIVAYRRVDP